MTKTAQGSEPRLVLVVDDDADVREAFEAVLHAEGYRVATVSDGEEALQVLRAGLRPCLILLDLMMPVKDGWQFRAEQRADPELAAIPTVVVSARRGASEIARSLSMRALEKPPDFDALSRLLCEHCSMGDRGPRPVTAGVTGRDPRRPHIRPARSRTSSTSRMTPAAPDGP